MLRSDRLEMYKLLSHGRLSRASEVFFFSYLMLLEVLKVKKKKNACGKTKSCSFLFPLGFFQFPACPFLTFLPSLLPSSSFPSSPFPFPPSFLLPLLSKTIKVRVIDDEEYEKNKTFYIEIGEPRLVESNDTKGQEGGEPRDPVNFDPPHPTPECRSHCAQTLHVHVEAHRRREAVRCFITAAPDASTL